MRTKFCERHMSNSPDVFPRVPACLSLKRRPIGDAKRKRGDEKRKTYGAVMPDSLPLWVMAEKEEKEEGRRGFEGFPTDWRRFSNGWFVGLPRYVKRVPQMEAR